MPRKPIKTVAGELAAELNDSGQLVVTLEYPDFYDICGRSAQEADGQNFSDALATAANTFGVIVGWGENVVCITHDKPHVP